MSSLELFDWDVVYATTFAALEDRLRSEGKLPAAFSGESKEEGAKISGTWGAWKLRSDSPSDYLWLQGTVDSGLFEGGGNSIDLTDSTWTVQVALHDTGGGVFEPADAPPESPHLAEFELDVKGAMRYQIQEIFSSILKTEALGLGEIVSIRLDDASLLPDQPWLRPTAARLALQPLPGDPRKGVVAVLAMTEGRSIGEREAAVDRRILGPKGGTREAALAIGPRLLTERLLRPALVGVVQGSSAGDFALDEAGVVLSNTEEITWGSFQFGTKDDGSAPIHPNIPKGNIELSLEHDELHLSMSNVNFHDPGWTGPGYITVSFDTEAFITFDFVLRDDGGLVMVPNTGSFDGFNVTVTPSESLQIFQIAVNVALQLFFAVLGGIVDGVLDAAENAASDALEEGAENAVTGDITGEMVDDIASGATEEEVEAAEQEAAENAGEAIANDGKPGYFQRFKTALWNNRWKIGLKLLEQMVEFPAGKITDIAVDMAKNNFDHLPSLNGFTADATQPVTWKKGATFEVKSGALEGALVFRGTLKDE